MPQYFSGDQGSVSFFGHSSRVFTRLISAAQSISADFQMGGDAQTWTEWGLNSGLSIPGARSAQIHTLYSLALGSVASCRRQEEGGYLSWSRADGWQNHGTKLRWMKSGDTGGEKSEFLFLLWKIQAGQYLLQSRWHSFPSFTLLGRWEF